MDRWGLRPSKLGLHGDTTPSYVLDRQTALSCVGTTSRLASRGRVVSIFSFLLAVVSSRCICVAHHCSARFARQPQRAPPFSSAMPRTRADRARLRREIAAARSAVAAAARNVAKPKARARNGARRQRALNNMQYTRPLRQGTAGITNCPYGARLGRGLRCFDANHPAHLPLPRAVGPYSVVRTTQTITTAARVNLIGTFVDVNRTGGESERWCDACMLSDVNANLAINSVAGSGNALFHGIELMGGSGWQNCTLCPAALTVQVMNSKAVSAADGIAKIGRTRFVPDLLGDTRLWKDFAEQAVGYNFPRLCSGGKLALRGVKVDAVPFNMSKLADFTPLENSAAGLGGYPFTLVYSTGVALRPEGFAPIMVVMDQKLADSGGLELLVTIEWRVRFDPGNPAQGTHQRWPVAADSTWGSLIGAMEAAGHGCVDIAEDVAEIGAFAAPIVAMA